MTEHNHADRTIASAVRTFREMMKAGHAAGLAPTQSVCLANAQAYLRTGVDILAELGIPDQQSPQPPQPSRRGTHEVFVDLWTTGKMTLLDGQPSLPFCPCSGSQIHTAYLTWFARAEHKGWPMDIASFVGYLAGLDGWQAGRPTSTWSTIDAAIAPTRLTRRMVIPSPEALAAAEFDGAHTIDQDNKPRGQWLAECYFAFQTALDAAKVNGDQT